MSRWGGPEPRWPLSILCGLICLAIAGPAWGTENTFDGIYTGNRVLTRGQAPRCSADDAVSVTIHGDTLTFTNSALQNASLGFDPYPDGTFDDTYTDIGGGEVNIQGRITGDTLEADVTNGTCKHHWHLTKEHHG